MSQTCNLPTVNQDITSFNDTAYTAGNLQQVGVTEGKKEQRKVSFHKER